MDYDDYWSHPRPGTRDAELARLLEHDLAAGTCLDFGCGDGESWGLWLQDRVGEYVGVDVSATAVEHARRLGLKAETIDGKLPFRDGSFDQAVSIEVLEHLLEPSAAVGELHRVLRPGGRLVVTTPNTAHWRRRKGLLGGVFDPMGDDLDPDQAWRSPHIRFFTASTLRHMLQQAGFHDVRVLGCQGGIRQVTSVTARVGFAPARVNQKVCSLLGRRLYASCVA